ncbi:hypothetical protein CALVIDRAFT_59628 [Calocera viscosa TUFC12733]|uniref:Uncharacterized protein n=1 Tax=Calocera viscosa (strain TUFC12733) TaxID=1330018 RepID=A0A167NII7_CALVF|nr:hypothetical protein CALVIDRAFT_59628 [Calocera viscosa TUFC12733]
MALLADIDLKRRRMKVYIRTNPCNWLGQNIATIGTSIVHLRSMASIQTPINPRSEHYDLYDEALQTGVVHPSITQNEESALHETRLPPNDGDYEDRDVLLCSEQRTLTIKHWLIAHPTLVINLEDIIWIHPASAVAKGVKVMFWGVSVDDIGWARDFHRIFPSGYSYEHSFVVKYKNPLLGVRAGFTIEHPVKFVETLEKLLPGITVRPVGDKEHNGNDYEGTTLEEDKGKVNAA